MKKIILMLTVALIVSGAVWAQTPNVPSSLQKAGDAEFLDLWAPTISTEKRYSAGTFDSDVDNFIDPTAFDGQIGTFVFAGGFPAANTGIYDDDVFTSFTKVTNKDVISLGFGKTLSETMYLGIYYGGSFVDASGYRIGGSDPDEDTTSGTATWRNRLAVLFGLGNMGFTVDLTMANTTDNWSTIEGKTDAQTISNPATIAIGWGMQTEKLTPWAKIGFKLPSTTLVTTQNSEGKVDKKANSAKGAILGLDAGVWYGLNDTSSALANLQIAGMLPDSYKGDKDAIGTLPGYNFTPKPPNTDNEPYTEGGAFGIDLYLKYTKAFHFGENVTVKLKPNLDVTFVNISNTVSWAEADDQRPSENYFELVTGLDVGAEYRYDKIALYSGLGLTIFDWTTTGWAGGGKNQVLRDTSWSFTGLDWDSSRFGTNGSLAFGLTFTPIEGLVFGTGLNIGGVFNPITMTLDTPAGGYGYFWQNLSASVTVSYKFANKSKEGGSTVKFAAEEAAE